MDINEATQILRVTDEEINAVKKYLGFQHTSINILSDLTPERFNKLNNSGWLLSEDKEDLKNAIKTFVDLYSLMYKTSLGTKGRRGLIRGTSIEEARRVSKVSKQFLSASFDETIAKRFCKYGSPALVRISVGDNVPQLYSEEYRTSGANEEELIIAPFCKITDNRFVSRWNGYEYYSINVEKGELQEKTPEEIEQLTAQILDEYARDIADMKEYIRLTDKKQILEERLQRTVDAEERKYISQDIREIDADAYKTWKRTKVYKERLNGLLQGMCREREKEIDQAKEIVDRGREQEKAEREQRRLEEEQQKEVSDIAEKIKNSAGNAQRTNNEIKQAYKSLLDREKMYKQFAAQFGFGVGDMVELELCRQVTQTTSILEGVEKKLGETQVPENSLEDARALAKQYETTMAVIEKSGKITGTLPELIELFNIQTEDEIKRSIDQVVQASIQNARINLLQKQKLAIDGQKLSIFDMITGKTKLQDLQLKNIELRMQLISESRHKQKQHYSIRDMLAEMYAFSQTELGGNYTPQMSKIYAELLERFRDSDGQPFTLDRIQKIAKPKIEAYQNKNLPAVPKKRFRLFGKNKAQIEYYENQNTQLQTQISEQNNQNQKQSWRVNVKKATTIFNERLMEISKSFCEGDARPKEVDMKRCDTVELW